MNGCTVHHQTKEILFHPRKHIWTYTGARYEQGTRANDCPCNNGSQYQNRLIPFVGNYYYELGHAWFW